MGVITWQVRNFDNNSVIGEFSGGDYILSCGDRISVFAIFYVDECGSRGPLNYWIFRGPIHITDPVDLPEGFGDRDIGTYTTLGFGGASNCPGGGGVFLAYDPSPGVPVFQAGPGTTARTVSITADVEETTAQQFGTIFDHASSSITIIIPDCGPIYTPTLTTQVSHASIIRGNAFHDTAILSGGNDPTGSIEFRLYRAPSTLVAVSTVPVSGNGSYDSAPYTAFTTGTYYWTASYSGDSANNSVDTAMGDPNETTIVQPPFLPGGNRRGGRQVWVSS